MTQIIQIHVRVIQNVKSNPKTQDYGLTLKTRITTENADYVAKNGKEDQVFIYGK